MAAPEGIVWGSTVGSYGRIGIYTKVTPEETQAKVAIQVWFWSKYSVKDSNNTYLFDNNATSASTNRGDVSINHTVDSGAGWSTSNQTMLGSYSYTYDRSKYEDKVVYCAAKLSGIDVAGGSMYASTSYTIPVALMYTITYNANGGTGVPSEQTKTHDIDITLTTSKPTRTGYAFLGWHTSSSATSAAYSAGATYAENESVTLYAVWKANSYNVYYNANGGTNAPATQIKTHGVALTLSTVKPSRTNYTFVGWGVSATATTASYNPGGSYTTNASITLYAIWVVSYTPPRITEVFVTRCDDFGDTSDSGTSFLATFNWETDIEVESVFIEWKASSEDYWMTYELYPRGTDGTEYEIVGGGTLSSESSYDVRITVQDTNGIASVSRSLPGTAYAIDFLYGGKGVAIGKPAEKEAFDVGMDTYVNGVKVTGDSLQLKGHNIFHDTTTDSPTEWADNGNLSTYFYTTPNDITTTDAFDFGFVLSLASNNRNYGVHQLWFPQDSSHPDQHRNMKRRTGCWGSWSFDWVDILDSRNCGDFCLPITGGTVTGYTKLNNSVNTVGAYRFHSGWIGFYASSSDAQANSSRKGWIGFDSSANFSVINGSGGSNIVNKAWTVSSDKRLKKDISDIPEELISIWKELHPKIFRWNELNYGSDEIQFGLIAQDVIEAFEKYNLNYQDYGFAIPYKIQGDDTEYFSITYDVYYLLTAAVLRETTAKLEDLQSQIDEVKKLISKQE